MQSDFYEIRLASIVSNVDKDVLVELYQPIIGANATILYLTLLKQKRNEDEEITYAAQDLMNLMQLDPNAVLSARHFLEAVGLMRTYAKESDSGNYYIFVLYAPKSPKDFFGDVLFKGLLIQSVGEKQAKKLAFNYRVNLSIDEHFNEVTASFVDVYHPDYDDSSFMKNIGGDLVGHEAGRVKIEFNEDLFFKYIQDSYRILPSAISKKELKEITRLAALFGLTEKQIAYIVVDVYDPNNIPHLDFEKVKNRAIEDVKFRISETQPRNTSSNLNGDNEYQKMIRQMERTSPREYLSKYLNNTPPSASDLNGLNKLSIGYKLGNGLINLITYYVMETNGNVYSYRYADKIASILVSNNVETVWDGMNVLKKRQIEEKRRRETEPLTKKTEEPIDEIKNEEKEEQISDEEMEQMLKKLEEKKKRRLAK